MHPRRRLAQDDLRELVEAVQVFAGADGRVGRLGHPFQRFGIFRRRRVFDEHRIGMFDGVAQLDHIVDRILPVALHREVGIAQGLPDALHAVGDAADVQVGELVGVAVMARLGEGRVGAGRNAVALHLEHGEAVGVVGLGFRHLVAPGLRLFGAFVRPLQGAIESHLVAESPAQKIADRGLQQAARQIPQRDFNARRGMHGQATGGAIAAIEEQQLGVELDHVQRVFADQLLAEAVQGDVLHAWTPIALADAEHPGIGFDLDQIPVPGAANDHHLDVGDLDLLGEILRLGLIGQREAGRGAHGQQFAAIQSHEMFPHPVLVFGGQIAGVRWKRQRRLSAYRL